ncbi:bifunctional RNase H/acid phosphatase [Plantactinospora soyae]|uniref:Phosphoglycerate mutase n=1 Tax=Plantactinospora soyae TaxID=1544732 RepID=A0A927MJB2_9ACTN|nr:bifunctional RNase H/acid phosphatase [Plantactinospora soyae]MBE1492623.1 putative phosphoglycerate mutase [Plantactinospora soyae]
MPGRRVVVEADGGARGNPGPAGYGAVVRDAGTGEVLAERSESIGVATNNVAEYRGLIAGLEAARETGAAGVEVRMDSKLVVEQMAGRWQIKNAGLRPLAAQAAGLVRRFDSVSYTWIPRERNRHADALANAAMDLAAGKVPSVSRDTAATGPAAESGGAEAPADPSGRAKSHEVAAQGSTAKSSWEPRPSDTATRLLLLRHGETEYTQRGRYSGRGDVPLSDRGLAQAGAAARRVAGLVSSVAAVVSSPLSRCTSMAGIIAGGLGGVPLVVEPDLIECDFGDWEGRTFAEVRERWPAELDAWLASPAVAPPGGESFVEVTIRVNRAMAKLLDSYPGETVVVVSHVSPVKIALRDALAATDAFLHRLYLDPAGLSLMDIWPDGGMAVRTVNDTAHLAGI